MLFRSAVVAHGPSPTSTDVSVQNNALLLGWTRDKFEQLTSYSQAFTEALADTLGVPLANIRVVQLADAADGSGLHIEFAVAHISSAERAHSLTALMGAEPYRRFLESELQHNGLPAMGKFRAGIRNDSKKCKANVQKKQYEREK